MITRLDDPGQSDVGRMLLVLFGRAEAGGSADVYLLAQRFGEETLLHEAEAVDTGFDRTVLGQTLGTLDDDEISLSDNDLQAAKTLFLT